MTVYVDNMRAPFGRLIMCHMIADTEEELLSMADKIGVRRKWHQHPGTHRAHFDIALSKRALAVDAGAIEITLRETAAMCARRRVTGELGSPADAEAWMKTYAQQVLTAKIEDEIINGKSLRLPVGIIGSQRK
jgi:hypothetical protein